MTLSFLRILGVLSFVFYISCSGNRIKSNEGIDSLLYYKLAYNCIKESKELLEFGNKYGILNVGEHLCVSSGLEKPTRGHFIQEYVDYIYPDISDSMRRVKRDSIILLPSEYISDKRIRKYPELGGLALKADCRVQVFFRQFKENYLEASVYVVQRYESDIFSFDNIVSTSLICFFIFENERIAKAFIYEATS